MLLGLTIDNDELNEERTQAYQGRSSPMCSQSPLESILAIALNSSSEMHQKAIDFAFNSL
jgi:hypothetical protein